MGLGRENDACAHGLVMSITSYSGESRNGFFVGVKSASHLSEITYQLCYLSTAGV